VINGNNETIEICMSDVVFENKFDKNPSVQIETSRNPKNNNDEIMKENLEKCMLKEKPRNHMLQFLYVGVFIV
jgi:hypothetical protein